MNIDRQVDNNNNNNNNYNNSKFIGQIGTYEINKDKKLSIRP